MSERQSKVKMLLLIGLISVSACQQEPSVRRDKFFRDGQRYVGEQKYLEAAIQFQNAVKADPKFAEGYYQLGLVRNRLSQVQEASQAFLRALEVDPQHKGAAIELGEIYLLANAPTRARETAEEILSRDPGDFSARVLLGKAYLGQKNFAQARSEFEKAKQLQPDNPALYLALGIAELGAGDPLAAEKNFKEALALDKRRIEAYQDLANLYLASSRNAEAEQILVQGIKNNPDNPRIHLALASFYYRAGRLSQVESVLESLGKQVKDMGQLHSDLGDFWIQQNEVLRAVGEYQASLSIRSSEIVKKKLVSAYVTLGNADEAERWNNRIQQKNDHEAKLFRGAIAYLRGNWREAIAILQDALAKDSTSIFGHYYLGAANLALGDLETAKTHLHECLKYDDKFLHAYLRLAELSLKKNDADGAAQYAGQVITLNPRMLEGYLLAADASLVKRDARRMEAALRLATRLSSDNYLVHERWAALYALRKDYSRAEREYQAALVHSPKPIDTLARMTRFYLQRGQIAKGLEQIHGSIASLGPNPALYEMLAELYLAQGAAQEAVDACQKALALDAKRQPALLYLGQALVRQDRLEEAAQSFTRAIELDPNQLPAYLFFADLHMRQGNFARAVEAYRQALKINPSSPVVQTGMARALAETGQELDLALSLAQQAKQQLPNQAAVSDALAWVYLKKGLNNLAMPLLKECLAKEPKNPVFQYHLGMVHLRSGDFREASRLLEAALKNGLASPYKEGAQQALSSLRR